jgi:predicted small lipoprotein YifL
MDKSRRQTCLGLVAAAVAVVSGCGQTGPLYFPEDRLKELKKKRRQDNPPKKDG